MKKTLLTSLIAAAVFAVVTPSAYAETANGTVITGNVYNSAKSGEYVNGATVTVTCTNNGKSTVKSTVTKGAGAYAVEYTLKECTTGNNVTVVANKGELLRGSNGGTVDDEYFHVRVGMVDVFMAQVPEFGLVTGAMAALTSGSSLFAFRRMRKA